MIILEDYRNLNRIDSSILRSLDFETLNSISIDSEIEIDKVRDPHSFTHVVEILDNEENGAIVFRASRRQLFMVLKEYYDGYKVVFSDYVLHKVPSIDNRYNKSERIDNENLLRVLISSVFQSVYEDDSVKKVWDILVIKKDNKAELKDQRIKSRMDMIPSEKEDKKGYDNYLKLLKMKLDDKLVKYKESKMPNLVDRKDFMDYLITNERLQKIKLKDTVYTLYEKYMDGHAVNYTYKISSKGNFPFEYITIKVMYNGLFPEIEGVYGHDRLHASNVSDALSYTVS